MEEAERWLKHQYRVYCLGVLWRGTPARELEPTAIHRFGLRVGASEKGAIRSQKDTVVGQPRKISCS
jgi:hypothetical protein